jgi:alpha(1,3/1,4) fucosyltransferase
VLIGSENGPRISVGFVGFHRLFDWLWNNITISLAHRFSLDVSEVGPDGHLVQIPDVLFFSVYEHPHRDARYAKCLKIFTCEENIRPPWPECSFALTGDYSPNPCHLRLPIYVRVLRHLPGNLRHDQLHTTNSSLIKHPGTNWETIFHSKTKFCNFVFSNEGAKERIRFFELLSKYKKVDSGGGVLNNLGYRVDDKIPFLAPYKFTIAFENSSYPGYVSEKIVEPMVVNSVPIYWGSSAIVDDFNPASFIDATRRRLEDVVDEVVELDRNDDLYIAKLRQPWFHENRQNHYCDVNYMADFLGRAFRLGAV